MISDPPPIGVGGFIPDLDLFILDLGLFTLDLGLYTLLSYFWSLKPFWVCIALIWVFTPLVFLFTLGLSIFTLDVGVYKKLDLDLFYSWFGYVLLLILICKTIHLNLYYINLHLYALVCGLLPFIWVLPLVRDSNQDLGFTLSKGF